MAWNETRFALDQVPNFVVICALGAVAGYSVSLLDTAAITVPLLGAVPGGILGLVGIAASVAAYAQFGCCGPSLLGGDDNECGCNGECSDRCSFDP